MNLNQHFKDVSILIVDDEPILRELVRDMLEHLGFSNITAANNGQKALDVFKDNDIDLLITDWEMDTMTGVELVREIRKMDDVKKRTTPIIMLSGRGEGHNVMEARDAGVTEFVVKPFTVKSVCQRIVNIIENPRDFVLAKGFEGPDRRRKIEVPPEESERRKPVIDYKKP